MFGSTIIDLAIGMIFVFLLLSLICSAVNELIELRLKHRAVYLEQGIRELLNDPDRATGMAEKVYSHPLVYGLFEKPYDPKRLNWFNRILGRVNLPSYIPARNFALALMDLNFVKAEEGVAQVSGVKGATPPSSSTPHLVVNVQSNAAGPQPNPDALAPLLRNIQSLPNEKARIALTALVNAANGDAGKARENIENWYNSSMDRVSGWYKRRAQKFLVVIGFIVAVVVNADSIAISKRLWADKPLRDSLVAAADAYAKANAAASPSPASTAKETANANAAATPATSPRPTTSPVVSQPTMPAESPATSPAESPAPPSAASPTRPGSTATQPTASASPTPTPPVCWKPPCKDEEDDSIACRAKKIECERENCWRPACPPGKEDTPECKLKKSHCEITELGLPIGWSVDEWPGLRLWQGPVQERWRQQLRLHVLGWLITAVAISLGAPFWFDLLNKFMVVRSTVKPKEKSPEEQSKD